LVEIENRSDGLRGFLHALQVIYEVGGKGANGINLIAGGTGNYGHKNLSVVRNDSAEGRLNLRLLL
jgi:hypothetical protein